MAVQHSVKKEQATPSPQPHFVGFYRGEEVEFLWRLKFTLTKFTKMSNLLVENLRLGLGVYLYRSIFCTSDGCRFKYIPSVRLEVSIWNWLESSNKFPWSLTWKLCGNFHEASNQISNVGNFLEPTGSNCTKLIFFNPSRRKTHWKLIATGKFKGFTNRKFFLRV